MILTEETRPLAVISGGGTGIGAATAHALARRGYDLVLLGRLALLRRLPATGEDVLCIQHAELASAVVEPALDIVN
ncbi:hypothetical protein Cs7R123_59630 [Catellatospora sp. TT07R-123]|uniref:hypothetical protein n=1 Tax=Catellatospora sp. TT07R-123 TaxID=2733863 RepID=UPI001B2DC62D|nr:hypothetical protein [Catellatospora sp. TT07R-123]GHJ48621.1 hypothetical protein Cs7R123_59630 [Catellatospora sp. TT07R-123]